MNQIDFLPASYHEQRVRRGHARRRWVLILLTLATLSIWGVARHRESVDLAAATRALEEQTQKNRMTRSEMDKLRQRKKELLYQESIQQQLDQSVELTQAVAVIGRLMPEATGLTQLTITTHRPDPKPREAPGDTKKRRKSKEKPVDPESLRDYMRLDVYGIAPDDVTVAAMLNTMSDHPLFDNPVLHFSRVDGPDDRVTRRFRIAAEVPLDRRYVPATHTAGVTDED